MSEPAKSPFFDVRMRGFRERASVDAVLALLKARTSALAPETVPLLGAAGRVLAESVVSAVDVPGFPRAAMDGFALHAADTAGAPVPLMVVGESLPARPFAGTVAPGQAVRITTGAPIPTGADAVLMAEFAQIEPDGRVLPRAALAVGKHVVRIGEDVTQGREVLPAGRRLRPQDVGVLASIGVGTVRVVRRPRVAILVTGNELLPPGSAPEGFKIVDSNSPMLTALATRDGADVLPVQYVRDDYPAVCDAIRAAVAAADVVLCSGGTSVGAEDHAPRAVAELGELAIHGVSLRPAAPLGVGFVGQPNPPTPFAASSAGPVSGASRGPAAQEGGTEPNTEDVKQSAAVLSPSPLRGGVGEGLFGRTVFLLPGNPVSCLCAYDLFAGRVIRRLGGLGWELPYRKVALSLTRPVASVAGRADYVRVKREGEGVAPVASSGASNLSSAAVADGFVLVPAEREQIASGETVDVYLFDE
ncbi:Molybdopterin molybdenumtransferase [Gemmata sp. SH-PL17]|uniref:molybdopterin molybdotransferase MoeA n=1 Tax=Gemmata sp. SH-PL17 TaxID=1630693 RepID=UPI0004B7F395|nr:molybdopterin molybdotransferase MoeA [Gemmata sp. SH-PL17]AMV30106.1 Molybdopterin molybdenumtransferase [Gemmata sp. SH-PL17]